VIFCEEEAQLNRLFSASREARKPELAPSASFPSRYLLPSTTKATAAVAGLLYLFTTPAFAQQDSGVRGGLNNTAGYLQYQGIPIPHPPIISANPTTGATITANELALFQEGINRAGQLESTCDTCADVTDGSPVTGLGELDPLFPPVPHQLQRSRRAS
jgi:hypothetical protein